MSLILIMIYWVFMPFLIFRAARWLYRRAGSPIGKGLVVAATLGLFAWFLWIAVGENMWLDHQVKELCAKDGGIKVYETVTLPADSFDKYGVISIPSKQELKVEDEYYYEQNIDDYKRTNPAILRLHFRVFRAMENKLLGEAIHYSRIGGGLSGPWHDSSFGCPEHSDISDLKKEIFGK